MSQITKCLYCGGELQENALFCPFCMQLLKDKKDISCDLKKRKVWPFAVLGVAVLLIAAVLIWLLWPDAPEEDAHKHDWEPVTETVHHEAVNYMDLMLVGYEDSVIYYCPYEPDEYLGIFSMDAMHEHVLSYHNQEPDFEYVLSNLKKLTKIKEEKRPVYDFAPYDMPAYDETVVTGYKCSTCGKTKEADDPPK